MDYSPEFKKNFATAYLAEEYERLDRDAEGAAEAAGTDVEMKAMADEDIVRMRTRQAAILNEIEQILKKEEEEVVKPSSVVMELRAGAGGDEAMGPAQFIPSTWALYADRVARGGGKDVANPWDPKDAIMAMSYLLADNGASAGGYTAEFNAAARYYAGWGGASSGVGRGYATQVMNTVKNIIQPNIDFLANI